MTLVEQQVQEFERRPAEVPPAEQARKQAVLNAWVAINRFEDIHPTELDKRLFRLLAARKVSQQEYRELSLLAARHDAA
jgi:hypothetical protein